MSAPVREPTPIATEQRAPTRKNKGVFISARLLAGLLILLILAGAAVLVAFKMRGSLAERGTKRLAEAYRDRRVIQPRLSGGFTAAAFDPSRENRSGIDEKKLADARQMIEEAAASGDQAGQLAYAKFLLTDGKLNQAIRRLRAVIVASPGNAEARNDLGACLLERGEVEDALTQFDRALELKANSPEMLFNRGLCYERLALCDAARQTYQQLIEVERDSGWKRETELRLESVTLTPPQAAQVYEDFRAAVVEGRTDEARSIARQNLEGMMGHTTRALYGRFLAASQAGDQKEAQTLLQQVEIAAEILKEAINDEELAELASYMGGLDKAKIASEAELARSFVAAETKMLREGNAEADKLFLDLHERFKERGNEYLAYSCFFYYAYCSQVTGRFTEALERFEEVLKWAQRRGWTYQEAQVLSQLGLINSRLGKDSTAISYCEEAQQEAGKLPALEAKTSQIMGNVLWHIGNINNALTHLLRSNRSFFTQKTPQTIELASNHLLIADCYRILGNNDLALLHAKEALKYSVSGNRQYQYRAQGASLAAVIHAQAGQFSESEASLSEASEALSKINPGEQAYSRILFATRAGEEAGLRADYAKSLEEYSEAERLIGQAEENELPMIRVLRGRAETFRRKGDLAKAEADLQRAVSLIEAYRQRITERKNRSDFLEVSQSVFYDLLLLRIGEGRWEDAFNIYERARARTLLDDLLPVRQPTSVSSHPGARSLSLDELKAALPDDAAMLCYAVTRAKLYIFVVTKQGLQHRESSVDIDELDRLVEEYVSRIKELAPLNEVEESGHRLYELLIDPVAPLIRNTRLLSLVPDKSLQLLPFAALIDHQGRFLTESFRLMNQPSASVFIRCLTASRNRTQRTDEKILAVGDPAFNTEDFPNLQRLNDAEKEADLCAAKYPQREILKGSDATKQRVLRSMQESDVAHLALHCVIDEDSPGWTALVLADSKTTEGSSTQDQLLHINEIYGIDLPRTRFVVLSACHTALGQYYRGEGIVSLARPFLALGVPTVVASLWEVDSRATADLMIKLHEVRRQSSVGAGEALQAAQLAVLKNQPFRHPYYWAAFIAVGSNS